MNAVDNTAPAPHLRREASVASVLRDWRRLTSPVDARRAGPGGPTLIACSGGADSTFLALALAAARPPRDTLAIGHIIHDLRPPAQALADRDAAARLAATMGLPFYEASVQVRRQAGNAEANARRLRYAALTRLARANDLPFIATAHHAHDQLESILMAIFRGSGPRGWRAIAERRTVNGVTVIRPMLTVSPVEARRVCREQGVPWAQDETNDDTSRLRNAIRHRVVPVLLELRPDAAIRGATFARHAREVWSLVQSLAGPHATAHQWPRHTLRDMNPVVLGEVLRSAATRHRAGPNDRLSARVIGSAVRLIRSTDTNPHALRWPGATVRITARDVFVEPPAP